MAVSVSDLKLVFMRDLLWSFAAVCSFSQLLMHTLERERERERNRKIDLGVEPGERQKAWQRRL